MPLLVVTGPPGAGKSTVARLLAADESPSALVTGDTFFDFLHRGGIDPWLPAAHVQNTAVVEAAAAAAGRLARDGLHVVFDGMVGPWFVAAFAAAAGLDVDYVLLLPDEASCLHRIRTRTGHGFSDLTAAALLHAQFAGAHIDERHVISDPPDDPRDVARLVRHRRSSGRLALDP